MKLLYAENPKEMPENVVEDLRACRFTVDVAADGDEALAFAQAERYDGIVLDISLPKLGGLEILKRLRAEGIHTPVMLLGANVGPADRIRGLELGADDYVTKPYDFGETVARIRAMMRRKEVYNPEDMVFGNMVLDRRDYTLTTDANFVVLPRIEYLLMELLMDNTGRWLATETILNKVWGYSTDTDMNTVWVYMSYLRRRLREVEANVQLVARRNSGYMLQLIEE